MSLVAQIITGVSEVKDGNLILKPSDFTQPEAKHFMNAFFAKLLKTASLTLTNASKESVDTNSITIRGTADFLGYEDLSLSIVFDVQDDEVVGKVIGIFPPTSIMTLPIMPWIEMNNIVASSSISQISTYFDPKLEPLTLELITFTFKGKIVTTEIPIEIQSQSGSEWRLTIGEGTEKPITLVKLVSMLAGNTLDMFIPAPLISSIRDGYTLNGIEAIFDIERKTVPYFSAGVWVANDWVIVPERISLKPGLQINLTLIDPTNSDSRVVVGSVAGTFDLNGVELPILMGATIGSTSLWSFGIQPGKKVTLPSFSNLLSLAGGVQFVNSLPAGLKDIPNIEIDTLQVDFNPVTKQLELLSFSIQTASPWTIIEGYFEIVSLLIAFDITHFNRDKEDPVILGRVRSIFMIGEYPLMCSIEKTAENLNWTIIGELSYGEQIDITAVASSLFENKICIPDHVGAQSISFSELKITVVPENKSFSFYASSVNEWAIINSNFIIKDFALSFDRSPNSGNFPNKKNSAKNDSQISGYIEASLQIATINLRLRASLNETPSGGWLFKGSTEIDQSMPIGQLITDLGHKFELELILPSPISGFTISNLGVSFNTESKDFTFTCEGNVRLPDTNTDISGTILIEIKHQQDGSFSQHFSGTLVIDELTYALTFEDAGQSEEATSKSFVAAYHDPKGLEIAIDPLIKRIFPNTPNSDITGLTLAVKDALFAYQSQTQAQPSEAKSNYLFGIDIDAGLNLSALKLPDLPLIGASFPPDQNLKLALQIFYAKSSFSNEAVTNLHNLNRNGLSLPQQEIKQGLALTALLRIGQEVKPLSLPIALDKEGKGLDDAPPSSSIPASDSLPPATAHSNQSSANVTTADNTQWLKIQKAFGPIHVERVGVGYQDSKIQCWLDADLTAAGLTLSLDGLGAEFALSDLHKHTFDPTFNLNGIGIDYSSSSLEIGGAFLKHPMETRQGDPYTSYAGLAVIRGAKWTLSAIGSYSSFNDHPSLFIYAILNYPLGGPAFFFITGFAAGFGYNRALTIPSIDEITTFPLVAQATKSDAPPASPDTDIASTITQQLENLEAYIPPSVGDIFIAAGITFTTFKQVNSSALLIVKVGQRFELDLLGLSTLKVPPGETGGKKPIATAQLALKATFIPDEGLLSIQAQLTANSHILSPDCHLTGGFAFFSWFKDHPSGAKAGDFVITLGGYHPKFDIPKHYPLVPRLGINWPFSDELLIKGQAYFALTSHAIMAGGVLEATYSSGALKAWFKAGADFLITWKPYHYDASFYINVGASYTFELYGTHTISVDLGADLHIWGPEFSGTATLHLWIISFTVKFGRADSQVLKPISWSDFKTSFLPESNQVCSINVQQGLIRQIKAGNIQAECWIVNPKEFVFATNSVIPSNEAYCVNPMNSSKTKIEVATSRTDISVAPVGIESKDLTASQHITITLEGSDTDISEQFEFVPILKAVPAALWGKPNLDKSKNLIPPKLNSEQLIENTLAGFEIRPAKPVQDPGQAEWIDCAKLHYQTELVTDAYTWQTNFQMADLQGKAAWNEAQKLAESNALSPDKKRIENNRRELLNALGLVNPDLDFGQHLQEGILVTAETVQ